ncbi:MAG: hypothetical protein ABH854_02170 [Candidatus Diapherotrites archaeon]|nr:hypothetical protein [Candidatus Micrarchaeota archaeon]
MLEKGAVSFIYVLVIGAVFVAAALVMLSPDPVTAVPDIEDPFAKGGGNSPAADPPSLAADTGENNFLGMDVEDHFSTGGGTVEGDPPEIGIYTGEDNFPGQEDTAEGVNDPFTGAEKEDETKEQPPEVKKPPVQDTDNQQSAEQEPQETEEQESDNDSDEQQETSPPETGQQEAEESGPEPPDFGASGDGSGFFG